ncbi:MAG: glycosyltransferase, partial [Chitinivibrionales bacterium]|nr:glycosyltransferase [Chitinivibrionales bacterium]MBD3396549.1 glycosyltransferase [Chitinivibrionales bacterium]
MVRSKILSSRPAFSMSQWHARPQAYYFDSRMSNCRIVHLFNFSKGSRYHAMISQGLYFHPDVEVTYAMPFVSLGAVVQEAGKDLSRSMIEADYIFRCNDAHFGFDEVDDFLDRNDLWGKVVYYDKKDEPGLDMHRLNTCAAYVKRSWTVGYNRDPRPAPPKPILPLDFGLLSEYYVDPIPAKKDIDVAYLFPPKPEIGQRRYRVYTGLMQARESLGNSMIGMCTAGAVRGRRALFEKPESNVLLEYLRALKRARIVFTAYPDKWDGDSRTWEAFASGAMVFMDAATIPSPHPLVHCRHCYIYDARDPDSIRDAIAAARFYLRNDKARRTIALAGYKYAGNHHRALHRVAQILSWVRSANKVLEEHVQTASQAFFFRRPADYGFPAPAVIETRPRPSFLGIGAQKAGTTWIHNNLSRHPDVFMPAAKEMHFFDSAFTEGLDAYLAAFAGAAGRICGEITPAYAILHPEEVRQVVELFPGLKVFFVLRNPVERAWSQARMEIAKRSTISGDTADIHEGFVSARILLHDSIARSDYVQTIRTWRAQVPKECFLALKYDEMIEDPERFLRRIMAFVDVDATIDLSPFPLRETPLKSPFVRISPAIRRLLVDLHERRIDELEQLLGWDL